MRKNQYKSTLKQAFLRKIPQDLLVIGVDEAGRGAWAGPVVAACVSWSWRCPLRCRLGDSKKLSPSEREKNYEEIMKYVVLWRFTYGVWIIDNTLIDTLGIREANRLAMQEALQSMYNKKCIGYNPGIILQIDGRDNYQFDIAWLPSPEYIVRGDSKIKQIMAASIIAKVTRDRIMVDYETIFPGYGFARHKGYWTQIHQDSLKKLGICEIHRKSYKPIKLATSRKGI